MNISEISIRKPVFAWMLMTALILFGGIAFRRMGVSQLPDVDFPMVNINLTLEGAAPEVMEKDIVEPVEEALMGISGLKSLSSASRLGGAYVSVEFDLSKNIDVAVQEVQTILAQTQRLLPKEMDPPTVSKINPEDQPIIWLTVKSSTMPTRELMAYVRDRLKDRFSTVDGMGEVILGGYVEPALRVWVNRKSLEKYDLAAPDVVSAIQNEHSELPAGQLETAAREWNVRSLGEAETPEEFAKIPLNRRGGIPNYKPLPLSSVATVEFSLSDIRRRSRSYGLPAVGLGLKKQRGTNAVEVGDAAKARARAVEKELPPGVSLGVAFDGTKFIRASVHELNFTLLLSALLTALVCWIFLGSWSATLNIIMAIPTSVVGSFVILYALGFTLNAFTLLGLSLAIGIVVDDAIMVLENIVRHVEEGENRFMAALIGSREITFAAIAATAAIIAIFLPVAFMGGIIGRYLYQFGVTLSVAVALSLLEALTLTPMRCSQFLTVHERTTWFGRMVEGSFRKGAEIYARVLTVVLRHRFATLFFAILVAAGSYLSVGALKKEFVPAQDQGNILLRLQTPVGSSLDYTDKKFMQVETILRDEPAVETYYAAIGGFGGSDVNTGIIFVTLKDKNRRPVDPKKHSPLTQQEFMDKLRERVKPVSDLKVVLQDLSLSGFTSKRGFPVEFTIQGPQWDKLVKATTDMTRAMEKSGTMTDIDSNYQSGMPEVQVIPDREKARAHGVSVLEINQTVNALIGGVIAGKYSSGAHRYDVRVRLLPEERTKAADIAQLRVRNNRGELVRLSDVAQVRESNSLQAIYHEGRERAVSVFANVAKTSSQAKAIETVQALSRKVMPPGYRAVLSGSSEEFQKSFQGLIFALILGIVVAYMVLASQFNSFIHPVTVLMALPFSVSGAFLALFLAHQSLNIYSMIGLVLLMGIVKKNSILLVDFTNQRRDEGRDVHTALMEACPVRLRPILMTSIATIAGALPAALAIGPGAEVRIPMAVTVIGGVLVSTVLTLLVVPAVYSLFSRIERRKNAEETPPVPKTSPQPEEDRGWKVPEGVPTPA